MYTLDGHVIGIGDSHTQSVLAAAHAAAARPQCLCRRDSDTVMYIAKVSGRYLIKRMPGTGADHDPACNSYAPPPEVSGLAHILGSAIREQADDPITRITLGFPLTHRGPRRDPGIAAADDSGDPTKLTLRGLLHLLWDDAGFTRWTPGMTGKRNWAVIRKYLLAAAEDKTTNRTPLINSLWVPEVFNSEHKADITARRNAAFSRITGGGSRRKLLIVVGEIKRLTPTADGAMVLFKHVPDCPFHLAEPVHARLLSACSRELVLRQSDSTSHLIGIATFSVAPEGAPEIEHITVMTVTEDWIPFDTHTEKRVIDQLTSARRRFVKSLRYNLPPETPLAALTLIDTQPVTACYITDPDGEQSRAVDMLVSASQLGAWIYDSDSETPPPPAGWRHCDEPGPPTLDLEFDAANRAGQPNAATPALNAGKSTTRSGHRGQ